jgi:dihydroorotase
MKLVIGGGRLIDPSQGVDEDLDILIVDGQVAALDRKLAPSYLKKSFDGQFVDASGLLVTPGLVDIHVHLREPGYEYRETILTGTRAALAGGFTSIACMPNSKPVNDNRAITEFIRTRAAAHALARVYPIAALSRGSEGKILTEFGDLAAAGAVGVSDDGRPVADSSLFLNALEYASSYGLTVISHCEDTWLTEGSCINEGIISARTGLAGAPSIGEDIMVARDILIAEYTKKPVHLAHVSTAGAVRLIREAKARGVPVTAETAPHYFSLTEEAVQEFSPQARVNPPLRTAADVAAIKEALRDGTLDAIASDHAPHGQVDKEVEFEQAASGISGLETSLGLSLKLVEEGTLTLTEMVSLMTCRPARILNLPAGSLALGACGDLNRLWTVDCARFLSLGKNSPFQGKTLRGKAVVTLVAGEIKWRDEAALAAIK